MHFHYLTRFINFYIWFQPMLSLTTDSRTPTTTLNKTRCGIKHGNDVQRNKNTWNMLQALGKTYGVKMWTLHFSPTQDKSWQKIWHRIFKEGYDIGYFSTNPLTGLQHMKSPRASDKNTMNLYVNTDINFLKKLLELEFRENLHPDVWMIKMPDQSNKIMMNDILNGTTASYDSNIFCYAFKNDSEIEIYDVYKISHQSSMIIKKLGSWNTASGLQLLDHEIWSRRVSLEGHQIKIVSTYNPPVVTYIEDNCTSRKCFKGMVADAWNALAEKMNFTYTIKKAYQWGTLENGKWNGMVGILERKEADIAVTDLTISNARSFAVDYLPSFMVKTEELFINNPVESESLDGYTAPLSFSSWIGVILWLILIPIILAGIVLHGNDQYNTEFGIDSFYAFVAQVLMMQTNTAVPTRISSKIAFGSVLVGGMFIYYNWEAELFAHLAVRKTNLPFKSLEELAKDSQYNVIVPKGSLYLDQFRYSNDPVLKQIWKEKIEPHAKDLPLYEDVLRTGIKNQHSVLYWEDTFRHQQAYTNCTIIGVGIPLDTDQIAWAIQKNRHFMELFPITIKE